MSVFLKLIKSLFNKRKIILFFRKKILLSISDEDHSCALVCLFKCCPYLSKEKIFEAFYTMCAEYPANGVSDNEFIICLKYLEIDNNFKYNLKSTTIGDLMNCDNKLYIALMKGHYTVIDKGNIDDFPYKNQILKCEKVYCFWELID